MSKQLREPIGPFETFDWFMAEIITGLSDSMAAGLMSLPPEKRREKLKDRVIELAAQKGIRLTGPEAL